MTEVQGASFSCASSARTAQIAASEIPPFNLLPSHSHHRFHLCYRLPFHSLRRRLCHPYAMTTLTPGFSSTIETRNVQIFHLTAVALNPFATNALPPVGCACLALPTLDRPADGIRGQIRRQSHRRCLHRLFHGPGIVDALQERSLVRPHSLQYRCALHLCPRQSVQSH